MYVFLETQEHEGYLTPGYLRKLKEKWYRIILIKFHLLGRLRATGNDGFKRKVMMGTFSWDNFHGNRKLLPRKQQQQRQHASKLISDG